MSISAARARDIAKDTMRLCSMEPYSELVQHAAHHTRLYEPGWLHAQREAGSLFQPDDAPLHTDGWNCSTLEAAARLHEMGEYSSIGVLNFASAKNPGGGFLRGARAQEESLARSSGLYPCLEQESARGYYTLNKADPYCVYTNSIIYSPDVPIFKTDKGDVHQPYTASFITVPAVNAGVAYPRVDRLSCSAKASLLESCHAIYPTLRNLDKKKPANYSTKEVLFVLMYTRIYFLLAVAAREKCDALVLGAFGCGVFRNECKDVAEIFHTLLVTDFLGCFKHVVFAVYGSPLESKYQVFMRDPFACLP